MEVPPPIWSLSSTNLSLYKRALSLTARIRRGAKEGDRRWIIWLKPTVEEARAKKLAGQIECKAQRVNPPEVVEALCRQWEGLVANTIRKAMPELSPHVDRNGLESECWYTLLKCAEKFDSTRGWKFSTYAINALMKSVIFRWMNKEKFRAELSYDFQPCDDFSSNPSEPGYEPGDAQVWGTLTEQIADKGLRWLGNRDERAASVLRWRLWEGLTLEEIGVRLGVSKERARQLQKSGIIRLRNWAVRRGLAKRVREGER